MTVINRGVGSVQRYRDNLDVINVGKLAGAGMLTVGQALLVHDSADTPLKDILRQFDKQNRFTDIQSALDACRSGANDYVFLSQKDDGYGSPQVTSYAGWAQTANVDIDKSNVHLVGLQSGAIRPLISFSTAHSVRIGPDNTAAAPVWGVELANLLIRSTGTSNIVCVQIAASALGYVYGTLFRNVEIDNAATTAALAEVRDYGNLTEFHDCVLGNAINVATPAHCDDNYLQVVATAPANPNAGRLQNTLFDRCLFRHFAAAVGDQFVTLSAGSLNTIFRDCIFYNYAAGSTEMTVGIAAGGYGFAHNCGMEGATAFATTSNVAVTPGGIGLSVTGADVFNPALAIDAAEPVASDT